MTTTYGGAAEKVSIPSAPLPPVPPSLQGLFIEGHFTQGSVIDTEVATCWTVVPKTRYEPKPPYQMPTKKKHKGPALTIEFQDADGKWKKGEWK